MTNLSDLFLGHGDVFLILVTTSFACSLVGVFLVLRRLSMLSDAISHSVFLGIVIAFLFTKDIDSPLLILGATAFGVFTTYAIESLRRTKLVQEGDAVGIIFPLFFSLAVILISKFARNVHLDLDVVLMGEVIMAPLNTMDIGGYEVPQALVQMASLFLLNSVFIALFYKELKVTTFDPEYAWLAGFSSTGLFYGLMTLTSMTAVASFDVVGAILVISFLIAPSSTAYLISKRLWHMIAWSLGISVWNALWGCMIALVYDVSISGMTATVAGVTFTLVALLRPGGVWQQYLQRRRMRKNFSVDLLVIHVGRHMEQDGEAEELGFATIRHHLAWSSLKFKDIRKRALARRWIYEYMPLGTYRLTKDGHRRYEALHREYNL